MADSAIRLLERDARLRAAQANARILWQDIADFVMPYQSNILVQRVEGAKQTTRLFDSTALHSHQLLASSLNASMTPATQPWLSLKMRQEALNAVKEVTDWLEDCAKRMHRAFRQSRFNQSVHELYQDLAGPGTGALFVEEKPITADGVFGGFRFHVPAIGTYTISEDADGQVDTLFRRFTLALRAAYAKWGDKLGKDLVTKLATKPDDPVEILHAVYPRTDRAYGSDNQPKRGAKNMPWASCYVTITTKVKVEEGGFEEFPYCVPRWTKTSGEVYGRGPSHTALPDIKSLNAAKELIFKSSPLAMQPPTVERDDAVVGEIDLTPGGRNVVTGSGPLGDNLAFLESKQRPDISQLVLAELRQSIRAIYFTDQLVLHEKPDMTATEVLALQEQMQRLLGPTTGRLESEFLNPLVQRCFGIMARARAFLPVPAAIREAMQSGDPADIDIEYEGPLARAQRSIEIGAQDRVVSFLVTVETAKAQFPGQEWDVLNLDKMIRDRAEIAGLPSDNLVGPDEVQQVRDQRAQAQQAQQHVDTASKIAEMAKNAAPFLKAAQPSGAQNGAQQQVAA